MATEVLYPHDLLSQRLRPHASDFFVTAPPRRKPHHHRTSNPVTGTTTNPSSSSSNTSRSSSRSPSNNPRPSRKDQKRRREGSGSPPPKPQHQQQQVVTLLRRGESLDSAVGSSSNRTSRSPSSSPSSTLPRKSGPATTGLLTSAKGGVLITPSAGRSPTRGSGGDMYAGSAFSMSPAPSDLPLPSFFSAKKDVVSEESVDHSATKDLLRLLRLE